ncbi:hypothetical protein MTF65_10020 [Streptomyces sp. APSN-46.1]|uniref:DUF6891 domain-containing protein n=1 Tax=Streptomyces sp. APSN-46.1 TaxID=2929049 RepID=UPI001FB4246E|nr:hypothetical protein [Streptomyces sp. APSN-46.1]MCJ1677668.1 hypothetical protein [Streptomyces sp. APSN-46.1]
MMAIRIQTERGESYERPALGMLSQLAGRIGGDEDRFLVVERIPSDPDVYIQVWHAEGGDYQLEHRAGAPERHFRTDLATSAEVVEVMARWVRQEKGWDFGPAWERLDFPAEEVPPLAPEVERELTGLVREWLVCGYDGRATLAENAEHVLREGDERPVSRAQAEHLVDRLWRERVAEQAGWEGETDPERLARAFAALDASGITARENFFCCRTCGVSAIREAGAPDARGFVFFHAQCVEGAAGGGDLYLLHGAFGRGDEHGARVGREVAAALDAVGLAWTWDGTAHDAIRVTGMDWRKRLAG